MGQSFFVFPRSSHNLFVGQKLECSKLHFLSSVCFSLICNWPCWTVSSTLQLLSHKRMLVTDGNVFAEVHRLYWWINTYPDSCFAFLLDDETWHGMARGLRTMKRFLLRQQLIMNANWHFWSKILTSDRIWVILVGYPWYPSVTPCTLAKPSLA